MNDLDFAIKMENDGQQYYTDQAEKNKNNSLYSICLKMAEDERVHGEILKKKQNGMPVTLAPMDTLDTLKNVFEGLGDMKLPEKELLNQFDFYRKAVDIEQKSIALYTGYLAKAEDDSEKELFQYLISQENQHFSVLDELSNMIRHSMEVQDTAEFGLRPEY